MTDAPQPLILGRVVLRLCKVVEIPNWGCCHYHETSIQMSGVEQ